LSQISHRDDFRSRLANLYEEWRQKMAADFAGAAPANGKQLTSPRTVATLVQAILHGLIMQRAADPEAYDKEEMLELCLDLLSSVVKRRASAGHAVRANSRKR
jgi:hypothetical protein